MENKIKFLIISLIITGLLFPNFASAALGVFDKFKAQLGAIEEFTGKPMGTWVIIFILYVAGLAALAVSGALLNWVIELPLTDFALISLNNEFVTSGWMFVSGLVNMAIILILLIIAFAYIFKVETFRAKQTFVRLIIVALLVNFSLVFVKALFDISNILYIYIFETLGDDFVVDAFRTFVLGLQGMTTAIIGSILALTAPLMLVVTAPWAQLGILVFWLTAGPLFIPIWLMQLAIAYLFSFIFILLFFLFAARIFIIWILAVLSPLAFVCLVLPQTKKWWDEWLSHLLEWMFVGMFVLFFLGLGLKTIPAIEIPLFIWVGLLPVPGWFIYYFFLFVYLLVIVWLIQKFMPAFASFLIDQSKALGGMIWTHGLKPMAGTTQKRLGKTVRDSERVRKWAERQATVPIPQLKGWQKLKAPVVHPIWALRRATGRGLAVTPAEMEKREMARAESEAEKIKDPTFLLSEIRGAIATGELSKAAGYVSQGIKKGGPFQKLIVDEMTEDEIVGLAKAANKLGAVPEAERIARASLTKFEPGERETKLKEMGFKSYKELKEEEKKEWDAKKYETITDKLIGEAKGDEIKDFAKGFWKSPEAMEAIQLFWGGSHLHKAGEIFGRDFIDDHMKVVEKQEPEKFIECNPKGALYLSGNAAQDAGYRFALSRPKVGKTIEKQRGESLNKTPDEKEKEYKERRENLKKITEELFPKEEEEQKVPSSLEDKGLGEQKKSKRTGKF